MSAQPQEISSEVLDEMPPTTALTTTENPYMVMASRALELGKVDEMSKLLDLQFKWEAEQARKAFIAAMAAFKSSPLLITKDKENKQYNSMYTTLGNLVNTASQAMAPHGLSADWDIEQGDKLIRVTCILSHEAGHSKRVTLEGAPDISGAKNSIQQIKSTVTYLRGATFEAVTGLASQEKAGINPSDDGNGAGKAKPSQPTAEQKAERRKAVHDAAYDRHSEAIAFIKDRIAAQDWPAVKSEWDLIEQPDQLALWLAPSFGGCLTTAERDAMTKNLSREKSK